jgi:glucose-1-phosphate cytidylyltransferase
MSQVVILCGGLGTRLREETEFRPKPMVEVGGRPILWHIMKTYAHYGFNDFILCLGYRGNIIKEYFLNYAAMNNNFTIKLGRRDEIEYHGDHEEQNFKVTLIDTGLPTMTGGRIKRIEKYITSDTFMVTYGDGLSDINIPDLLKFHKDHGKIATLSSVRPSSRFGVIDINPKHQVTEFREKPISNDWISAGYFVFDRKFFEYLPDDDQCIMEREPMEMLARNQQLMAYHHQGFFYAMDTYREYEALNKMWNSGNVPWKVWS